MKEAVLMTRPKSEPKQTDDWTILYCLDMEEVREAIEDKTFVFPQIRRGIRRMLEEERTSWMITEIWCIEALSSVWISITLDEAEASLKLMLNWHLEREEYEECSEVTALINAVIEAQRKRKRSASDR